MDGWMARFRGPGWAKRRTSKPRVEWHEIKTGRCHAKDARFTFRRKAKPIQF
jgi:hypothetical protein